MNAFNVDNKIAKKLFSVFVGVTFCVVASIGLFFVYPKIVKVQAIGTGVGDVLINEFFTNPSEGQEWYELLNTTGNNIDLSGWSIDRAVTSDSIALSGTLPANGILVFYALSNHANDGGDMVTLKDGSESSIHAVSYGSVDPGGFVPHSTAPELDNSGFISDYGNPLNYSTTGSPSKGWFNDAGQPGKAPLLTSVDSLLADASIYSNIGEQDNPSATPATEGAGALYFEKIIGETPVGKIVFEETLNLSDQNTVAVLQELGEKMEMSGGHIKFDSATADAMNATGAKIYMYGLDALGFVNQPNIIVKNDASETIDGTGIIADVTYTPGGPNGGELSFGAAHFTQFDLDTNVYVDDDNLDAEDGTQAHPFNTIAEGVAAVPVGGTVHVASGSYTGNVGINKSLTIQGENSSTVMVTAPFASHGFDVSANNVTISGMTITGATGGGGGGKAGVNVNTGVSDLTVSDNIISGNRYGIKTKGTITNLTAQNNSIESNSIYGLYIIKGTSVDVTTWAIHNNSFTDNGSRNIYKEGIGTLNAENNWWGTDIKADIYSSLSFVSSAGIDIVPFYTDASRTTLSDLTYTFTVCAEVCDYTDIQSAINAADYESSATSTSNIIDVLAGNYSGPINVTKPVSLRGPNADISPISGTRGEEAILDGALPLINLTTDRVSNVTVEGFKLIGTTWSAVPGVIYSNKLNAHNVTIRSNIFSGSEGRSIFTTQGEEGEYRDNWLITDNIFENIDPTTNPFQAAMMIHSIQNSNITNNQISNTSYGGIQIGHSAATTISGNHVTDVPRSGIQVAYSSGITVENNTITNAGNGEEMTDVRGFGAHTDDLTENGGITLYNADQTNITITGNTITGSYNGIAIRNDGGSNAPLGSEISVNENSITGSIHYAVENLAGTPETPVLLNAEHNYWGSSFPDFGTLISGDVDYSPWWVTASGPDVVLSSSKAISSFTIPGEVGVTTINHTDHTVSLVVPFGTNVTALVPTITFVGGAVSPASGVAHDFTVSSTYTVTATDNTTQNYTVTVTILSNTQAAPDSSGDVTLDASTPNALITDPDQAVDIAIGSGTTSPKIDVSGLITAGTGVLPQITVTSANANNATVAIPAATTVTSADPSWDGIIAAPTITTVTLPDTSGETKTLSTAVEVGFTGAKLSFDKAVRLLLPGQAGKKAGYVRTGISFTEITSVCTSDSQATGNALAVDGDCKIDVGADLVIWTKHFTTFASYSQTTNAASSGSSSGGGLPPGALTQPIAPAGGYKIIINDGASSVSNRNVVLKFTVGSDIAFMAISNQSDLNGAARETYVSSKNWTLTAMQGVKTVYVKFFTSGGQPTATVSNTIVLLADSSTPAMNVYSPSEATASIPDIDTDKSIQVNSQSLCTAGSLIKTSVSPAVYYCGKDGKRYGFPNEKTYKTWYKDFSGVNTISETKMSSIQIGNNVTYRPGVKMVKIKTSPTVYAVSRGGILRPLEDENVAKALYGNNWNSMVDDVHNAFFDNYSIGESITLKMLQ